jgi:hypothetical protein
MKNALRGMCAIVVACGVGVESGERFEAHKAEVREIFKQTQVRAAVRGRMCGCGVGGVGSVGTYAKVVARTQHNMGWRRQGGEEGGGGGFQDFSHRRDFGVTLAYRATWAVCVCWRCTCRSSGAVRCNGGGHSGHKVSARGCTP